MRELISMGLGPTANFTLTHFWNSQDELMKQDDAQLNNILYYEGENTKNPIPRTMFFDFRDNFGNFLSCFSKG